MHTFPSAYVKHREELRTALDKAFLNAIATIGEGSKNLDWFAGNNQRHKEHKKKAA